MSVVVDADVLIDTLRGGASAIAAIIDAKRQHDRILSITPVRAEVLRGMLPGEEDATARLIALLEWVPVDVEMADRAGELGRVYRRSHSVIDVTDLLIAAAVERHEAELLTRNVRHFPMFPELKPAF
jgi:predicted nucleic acid-binding protein